MVSGAEAEWRLSVSLAVTLWVRPEWIPCRRSTDLEPDLTMEKRVFLAIALSLLVLTLYQTFVAPPPTVTPASAPAAAAEGSSPATSVQASVPSASSAPFAAASAAAVQID